MNPLNMAQIGQVVKEEIKKNINLFPNSAPEVEVTDKDKDSWMYCCLWPDNEKVSPGYRIKASILNINPELERDEQSAVFKLRYRRIKPALIIDALVLHPNLQKRGLGNILVENIENIAHDLDCEKRIFLHYVTNPSFWTYKGYKPKGNSGYWKIAR